MTQTSGDGAITPFHVAIPQAELDDLEQRLARTRWPEREVAASWSQGVPLAKAQALIAHWHAHHDWRKIGRMRNTRELVVAHTSFLIIYRIRGQTQQIEILRVIHGAQRWPPKKIRATRGPPFDCIAQENQPHSAASPSALAFFSRSSPVA
jgi:epoxide hydrolase